MLCCSIMTALELNWNRKVYWILNYFKCTLMKTSTCQLNSMPCRALAWLIWVKGMFVKLTHKRCYIATRRLGRSRGRKWSNCCFVFAFDSWHLILVQHQHFLLWSFRQRQRERERKGERRCKFQCQSTSCDLCIINKWKGFHSSCGQCSWERGMHNDELLCLFAMI